MFDPWHYVPVLARKPGALRNGAPFKDWVLPAGLERIRRKLAGAADSDRQMVNILTAVLSDGLPAVEAACLEALREGVHSADVVINILTLARAYDPQAGRWLSRDPLGEATDPYGNLYAYVGGNPIIYSDPLGFWTIQIGGSIGYTLPFGLSGTFFAGVALDDSGNAAIYYGGGAGYGAGAGASIAGDVAVSDAQTVNDLGGPFVSTNTGVGNGGNVGVTTFNGASDHGYVVGGGVSGGIGLGGTSYAGPTNTTIVPLVGSNPPAPSNNTSPLSGPICN